MHKYFIHGNGQSSKCAPVGYLGHDIYGHGNQAWDTANYSMEKFVDFFVKTIPENSFVLGHSLGGHIGLNVALKRKDIKLAVLGMAPIKDLSQLGTVMKFVDEFVAFQNPQRNMEVIEQFVNFNLGLESHYKDLLTKEAQKQDPSFNQVLFSLGIANYDWNEVEKAKSLGDRFTLILSENESVYDNDLLNELPLNIVQNNYLVHTPWLDTPKVIDEIESRIFDSNIILPTVNRNIDVSNQVSF